MDLWFRAVMDWNPSRTRIMEDCHLVIPKIPAVDFLHVTPMILLVPIVEEMQVEDLEMVLVLVAAETMEDCRLVIPKIPSVDFHPVIPKILHVRVVVHRLLVTYKILLVVDYRLLATSR